tara:strand:+ start:11247 stop:12326 length:1080 start_codon:yes stop_codon:yes gene_type:complete
MENSKNINWQKIVKPYANADHRKSWLQFFNTVPMFFLTWFLAYKSLNVHYALTLLFSVACSIYMVRIFIIMHDCGHGSYFKSKKLRTIVGYITGIISLTPYVQWCENHATHHQTSGNLDKRGTGDVWTMTLKEYETASKWEKFQYRFYRFPLVTFIIGPVYLFWVIFRFTEKHNTKEGRQSVYITNIALAIIAGVMAYTIGWKNFLLIEVPIVFMAQLLGTWLFYVQHQYEDVYWARNENWSYFEAAIHGSSFLNLPKVMHWCTGYIGYHHLHHLSHKIPNYNLAKCHEENEIFHTARHLGTFESFKSIFMNLYDEEKGDLISFNVATQRMKAATRDKANSKVDAAIASFASVDTGLGK